ncbi:MAG TPA: thioredoxin fold domain-containing protein [Chloroflexi bacterium]|nr:thioredoxin fold domain-containing protein [Chloroflexota bacterium]
MKIRASSKHLLGWLAAILLLTMPILAGCSPDAVPVSDEPTPTAEASYPSPDNPTASPSPTEAPTDDAMRSEMPDLEYPGDQIEWVIENNQAAMVMFYSDNCPACRVMWQSIERVQPAYENRIVFISVSIDDPANIELVHAVGIRAIPTTFFLRDGESVDVTTGALPDDALRAALDRLLAP